MTEYIELSEVLFGQPCGVVYEVRVKTSHENGIESQSLELWSKSGEPDASWKLHDRLGELLDVEGYFGRLLSSERLKRLRRASQKIVREDYRHLDLLRG